MASVVGICNSALQKLGETRITSLSEDTERARDCNDQYERTRDALLRRHKWNFAITREDVAADGTAPSDESGFSYSYTLPTDCLRVLPPRDHTVDWSVEGRKILTNWSAPLHVRYVARITDPNEMDALFREALATQLAYDLCEKITQSNQKKAGLGEDLKHVIAEAKRAGAIEQIAEEPPEDEWITVRD